MSTAAVLTTPPFFFFVCLDAAQLQSTFSSLRQESKQLQFQQAQKDLQSSIQKLGKDVDRVKKWVGGKPNGAGAILPAPTRLLRVTWIANCRV
ncbi:hypothetical protein BC940DRAFT_288833 [Gongronella butleri]|nr:hypothetical protein BC940DRAFT_288833 [Gongronella butleri]